MNRKKFLLGTMGGLSGLILAPGILQASGTGPGQAGSAGTPGITGPSGITGFNPSATTADPDPYPMQLVKEFVIAGHGNLPKVQSMLKDYPNLLFCKFDWGNGDFEAGIEGAGHLGNKEIATFLIDSGARVTLFVLTMLGRTDLVKPILEAYPKSVFANGPHGLTLLHHAKVGGKEGEELYQYLQEKGLTKDWIKIR